MGREHLIECFSPFSGEMSRDVLPSLSWMDPKKSQETVFPLLVWFSGLPDDFYAIDLDLEERRSLSKQCVMHAMRHSQAFCQGFLLRAGRLSV